MSYRSRQNQLSWWETAEDGQTPSVPKRKGVAYYRHSAQDRQENSVAIQQDLVRKWAEENGVDIIHEFADRGKSGLTAEGRDGFNDMMDNWVKKKEDFDFVLCLDVSRWGRFQDIDLSATYSAECKKHGKDVIYTTLGKPRSDDQFYSLCIQFERVRAAQYSKELSTKVFHGCITIAKQGYWAGGKPPYGYSRLLLDEARNPLHVLEPNQKKSIQNQRVTLTPGPADQVEAVRRIFREFVQNEHVEHLTTRQRAIADGLNRDGIQSPSGSAWDASKVKRILINPMYTGTLVYNKTTQKLKTPTRRNPEDQWIKTDGAFDPLIDPELFQQAQSIFAQTVLKYTPEAMISRLECIYQEFGFIRASMLQADKESPSATTYAKRFRSLDMAYQQVFSSTLDEITRKVEFTLRDQVDEVERHEDFLVINRRFTVLVQPSVPVPHGYQHYWYFRPDHRSMIDITLGVPVSGADQSRILGYVALPRLLVRNKSIRMFGSSETRLSLHGHTGLDMITQLAKA